jgi:hypothetical protein
MEGMLLSLCIHRGSAHMQAATDRPPSLPPSLPSLPPPASVLPLSFSALHSSCLACSLRRTAGRNLLPPLIHSSLPPSLPPLPPSLPRRHHLSRDQRRSKEGRGPSRGQGQGNRHACCVAKVGGGRREGSEPGVRGGGGRKGGRRSNSTKREGRKKFSQTSRSR